MSNLNFGNAFDLSSLKKSVQSGDSKLDEIPGIEATAESLPKNLLPLSNTKPVIILCWSQKFPESVETLKLLGKLNKEDNESWQLATVEIEKRAEIPSGKKRFSYKEKREFEQLGKEIETLSERKKVIQQSLEQSDLTYEKIHSLSGELVQITNQLDEKELRWLELSEYTE